MRTSIVYVSYIFGLFFFMGCGSWTVENPNPECEIMSVKIMPEQVDAESVAHIIITTKVKSGKLFREKDDFEIQLFNDIGDAFPMFDDGKHGDEEAKDGIYGTVLSDWTAPATTGLVSFEVRTIYKKNKKQNIVMFAKGIQLEVLEKKVAPTVEKFSITPIEIEVKLEHNLLFSAKISDENGFDDISTVIVDLTAFGGDASQMMFDDGKHDDGEAGDGLFAFMLENFKAPNEITKLSATVGVTDKDGLTASENSEISTYPTPNAPAIIEKITVEPKKVFFDTTINLIFTAKIYDQDGYEDVKSVKIDLSNLGIDELQIMFDDGTHYDNVAFDGVYGFVIADFTPIRVSQSIEIKIIVTDSQTQITEKSVSVEIVDPASLTNKNNPTLDDTTEENASDEIKSKFKSMYDGLKSSIYLKEKGKGDNKIRTSKIIIKEENKWDPGIVGYRGFREGGMEIVLPTEWKLSRNHELAKSVWTLNFKSGYIRIEMLPYKVGDEDALNAMAQNYHDELKEKYTKQDEAGEIMHLSYDERFKKYKRLLDQDSIWFDYYIVANNDDNITHSVYMFYALEASSSVENPIYRTFKIEFVRIPIKFRTNAFDIFVDNFIVK
ncbi:MAG: hypothetical protein K8S87_02420 [Planctomycetes bacterium]|nr:hypothetical protein [Planctomycetota bacterium]